MVYELNNDISHFKLFLTWDYNTRFLYNNSKSKKDIKANLCESVEISRIYIVSEKRVLSQKSEEGLFFKFYKQL